MKVDPEGPGFLSSGKSDPGVESVLEQGCRAPPCFPIQRRSSPGLRLHYSGRHGSRTEPSRCLGHFDSVPSPLTSDTGPWSVRGSTCPHLDPYSGPTGASRKISRRPDRRPWVSDSFRLVSWSYLLSGTLLFWTYTTNSTLFYVVAVK